MEAEPREFLDEIWTTTDRLGRTVTLHAPERDHIIAEHDELADRLHENREAIEYPAVVARDRRYRHREVSYAPSTVSTGQIKVVVHYRPVPPQGTWAGKVITAYPVSRRQPGEELLET